MGSDTTSNTGMGSGMGSGMGTGSTLGGVGGGIATTGTASEYLLAAWDLSHGALGDMHKLLDLPTVPSTISSCRTSQTSKSRLLAQQLSIACCLGFYTHVAVDAVA